jgi:hypothetical protein
MKDEKFKKLLDIQDDLKQISIGWGNKWDIDLNDAAQKREQAILINHQRYYEQIPAYRKLVDTVGLKNVSDIKTIKAELMSTDDMFKSYNAEWVDNKDFGRMTEWLRTVYSHDLKADTSDIRSIDGWIRRLLEVDKVQVVFSSGTRGKYSFLPKDDPTLRAYLGNGVFSIMPRILSYGLNTEDYEAVVLGFQSGFMGITLAGVRISQAFSKSHFLYETHLDGDAIRAVIRGPQNQEQMKMVEDFMAKTVHNMEGTYVRIAHVLEEALARGKRVTMVGAPFQYKELCDYLLKQNKPLKLLDGSLAMYGGGWKTFEGEKISKESFVNMLGQALGIPPTWVMQGYSMAEANDLFVECESGKIHMSPLIEPVIVDEDLMPVYGDNVKGLFGFLDPFAASYPGFIITGDQVNLITGKCQCGRLGHYFEGDITRAAGKEVKGCAGVMGSVRA